MLRLGEQLWARTSLPDKWLSHYAARAIRMYFIDSEGVRKTSKLIVQCLKIVYLITCRLWTIHRIDWCYHMKAAELAMSASARKKRVHILILYSFVETKESGQIGCHTESDCNLTIWKLLLLVTWWRCGCNIGCCMLTPCHPQSMPYSYQMKIST